MTTKRTAEERAATAYPKPVVTDIGYKNMRIGFATCIREEVEPLEQWKESAINVMSEWDKVHEALGKPGKLGESMAAASLAEVAKLRALVQGLFNSWHTADGGHDMHKWISAAKEQGFVPTNTQDNG